MPARPWPGGLSSRLRCRCGSLLLGRGWCWYVVSESLREAELDVGQFLCDFVGEVV